MRNINKYYHTIEDAFYTESKITLECLSSREKFDKIKGFWSSIFGNLEFLEIHREEKIVKYQVELYRDVKRIGDKREEFYAILKNGKKERVWKPSPYLKENILPKGYSFTNRYLNLCYQKKKFGRISLFTPILKHVEYTNTTMKIQGYLFLPRYGNDNISKFKMQFMKFRDEKILFEFPFQLKLIPKDEIFGFFSSDDFYKFNDAEVFLFDIEIPLSVISFYSGIFNIVIENSGRTRLLQNYHSSLEKTEKLFAYNTNEEDLALFNFYYDDIVTVWRFEIYHMSQIEYQLLKTLKKEKREPYVWLIGEQILSAQDNGKHFYHYMIENHPEIEVYYVIEKSSKDFDCLESQGVLAYGSYKHFEVASRAKVLVFSHMPNYLIPKINHITEYKNRYKAYLRVFLQHGVIANKNVDVMHKNIRDYDIFNVSSKLEKSIIHKNLGYSNNEIIINGLPRWDRLFKERRKSKKILIMPTFRDNLEQATEQIFKESDYFNFWNGLLSDKKFVEYIEQNNIIVYFFLHIILERFSKEFLSVSKNILFKNSDNLQDLLLECGMLVTDYSSVSFDMLFQNKPVIYVPFDSKNMMKLRGGGEYIDYQKDLPGDICFTIEETIDAIVDRVDDDWSIETKYEERRLKFFDYIDADNSKRVYHSIINRLDVGK